MLGVGAARLWMRHTSVCVAICPFPWSPRAIAQLLREDQRLPEGRAVCPSSLLPILSYGFFHFSNPLTAISKKFLGLDFSNGQQAFSNPTPDLQHTHFILFHFKWRFLFFQEPIYCVFTTYAYLGAYQKNSPQQLKICRTNLKLNTSGSINTGVLLTPPSWLSVSNWVLVSLGLPARTQACCWQEEMLLIDRLALEGGTRVTASAHGGGSAPEAHQQTVTLG